VKQRKIAISLAVVGAITAPFVFGTYKERPITHDPPLTAKEKADIAAELKETNNCQTYHDRSEQFMRGAKGLPPDKVTEMFLRNNDFLREGSCKEGQRRLEAGGDFKEHPDTLKYLAINAATAGSAFVVIYGLAYLLPAIARRYWRWLNT